MEKLFNLYNLFNMNKPSVNNYMVLAAVEQFPDQGYVSVRRLAMHATSKEALEEKVNKFTDEEKESWKIHKVLGFRIFTYLEFAEIISKVPEHLSTLEEFNALFPEKERNPETDPRKG